MNLMVSAVTVSSAAIPTAVSTEPDPIFAAIQAHKVAFRIWMQAADVCGLMAWDNPRLLEAEQASAEASAGLREASMALTSVQPMTHAGVLALLAYVDAFNSGEFKYPAGDSRHHLWPCREGEEASGIDDPVVLPFPYLVMNNIRDALARLG